MKSDDTGARDGRVRLLAVNEHDGELELTVETTVHVRRVVVRVCHQTDAQPVMLI